MRRVWKGGVVLVSGLLGGLVPGAQAYVRNQTGSVSAVYRLERTSTNGMTFLRNDSAAGIQQPGGATLSEPALTTLSSTVYGLVRGTNQGIYCNRYTPSTNTWAGWINLGGATLDAPAIASNGSSVYAVVRGTDNGVYYRNVTTCGGAWVWTGQAEAGAPQLTGDASGFYIYISDPSGLIRRHRIGECSTYPCSWPRVWGFENDPEWRGAKTAPDGLVTGATFGIGARQHKYRLSNPTLQSTTNCPAYTIPALTFGRSTGTKLCYAVNNATGGMRVRHYLTGPDSLLLHRTCQSGFYFTSDGCDWDVGNTPMMPMVSTTTRIPLRTQVTIDAARVTSPVPSTGFLEYLTWVALPPFDTNNRGPAFEIIWAPFYKNASSCYKVFTTVGPGCSIDPRTNPAGNAAVLIVTPACYGGSNTLVGQTRTYNVDLRPVIVDAIQHDWYNTCGWNFDDNVAHYKVANGPWIVTKVDGGLQPSGSYDYLEATTEDTVLEELF